MKFGVVDVYIGDIDFIFNWNFFIKLSSCYQFMTRNPDLYHITIYIDNGEERV